MSGSRLQERGGQAQMGVYEASLPRLTAQKLLRTARHLPQAIKPDLIRPEPPRTAGTRGAAPLPHRYTPHRNAPHRGPVPEMCVSVCVRVCRTLFRVSSRPGLFPRS